MAGTAASLFWIALCAVAAPLIAALVPRRLIPEVVLLLALGVVIGPGVLGLAALGEGIEVLREFGLGMLFLLAGYEIEPRELTGRGGRRALVTWVVCFALALGLVGVVSLTGTINAETAVAIALVSTSLGTLLPILKDSDQLDTKLGAAVLNHGAFGELCPVIAMALLLSSRGTLASIGVLAIFTLLAVIFTLPSARLQPGSRTHQLVIGRSETTAQITVRLVVLLLVSLGGLAIAFDLDVVLGAFAAGFVLRRALPEGDESLEHKLGGLAFGLLIPIFFITSGMAIDPRAIAAHPLGLLIFVLAILVVRGGPIYVSSRTQREPRTRKRLFSGLESAQIALYGATGLPIIVAVTAVAVKSEHMSSSNASLLVAGGAITVLLLPMTAALLEPSHGSEPQTTARATTSR
jgi:Kef-type K+ transport system membrane component KefB